MIELIQLKSNTPKVVKFNREGIEILIVESIHDLQLHDVIMFDAIIIQTLYRRDALEILRELRSSSNILISLKPIFLSSIVSGSNRISYLFDGTYSEAESVLCIQSIREINLRIRELKTNISVADYDLSLIHQTIRFCYTRNKTLIPKLNRSSSIGYSFPFLSSIIEDENSYKIIILLEKCISLGYFNKQVVDQVQACKKCSGGYLNYRETCPKCSSKALQTEDLFHHFSCAYIAPESNFKKGDNLICPKCEKKLRHIGIDYDKPSAVHTCNSCDHTFQNATIKAQCVDCGTDNELHQLTSKEICNYSLTQIGVNSAKSNTIQTENKVPTKTSKSIPIQIFEMFREQEIKRLQNSDHESWEGSIKLNSKLIQTYSDEQKQLIREEVQEIISGYLNDTDILSSSSPCWHRFILFDKDGDIANRIADVIQNNVKTLLSDNFNDNTHNVESLLTSLNPVKRSV